VGQIAAVEPMAVIVERLKAEYDEALANMPKAGAA
jgi:hypothetical protein